MKILAEKLYREMPPVRDKSGRLAKIRELNKKAGRKVVVLDDDPTGTQTVHNVRVLTAWDKELIREAFLEEGSVFYILTNSRSYNNKDAAALIKEIISRLLEVSADLGIGFAVVDRGDSTLRGHYPLENEVIKAEMEKSGNKIDGEIIAPFFKEGRRFTYKDIHWVGEGKYWVPAAETEFAGDPVFSYKNSDLKLWVEEKTGGRYRAEDVLSVSVDDIRNRGSEYVFEKLMKVHDFGKVILNSVDYPDLEEFMLGLLKAEAAGRNFIYRTAASFVRVRAGIEPRELLSGEEIIDGSNRSGGLIIVGSHVNKTTKQLQYALEANNTKGFEMDVEKLLAGEGERSREIVRAAGIVENAVRSGVNAIVYTSRKLITSAQNSAGSLDISQSVSSALVEVTRRISVKPRFIIAKGGITSSDIATRALEIRSTRVMGQIRHGIPVWATGEGTGYIIFPGNVGTETDLRDIINQLSEDIF